MRRSPDQARPEFRRLRIYAIDPMVSHGGDHQVDVQIRFEDLQVPDDGVHDAVSIKGRRIEVVDVDAATQTPRWLKPVDLDHAYIAMQHGLEPSENDPQFHQQMVYAVAMRTLEQFDRALGRTFQFPGRHRLRLVPHAFRGRNAFFDPKLRAVLFGYFQADEESPGENLPGQIVFTCLSHDIIAHEVTHAVVDRVRPFFNTVTNNHVPAFHEAFADIVAVFQRFLFRDLVRRTLQESGGKANVELFASIAVQFGQGMGYGRALRTALNDNTTIRDVHEAHDLGAVLVAAVFEAFLATYERRCADLVRIATGGTGILPAGALHPDLVDRMSAECVRIAQVILTMCIRGLDYLPPADVTFAAFLRAIVTADWELNSLDESGVRAALVESCRRRGIVAQEAGSLATQALLLDMEPFEDWKTHRIEFCNWVDLAVQIGNEDWRSEAAEDDPMEISESLQAFATSAPSVSSDSVWVDGADSTVDGPELTRQLRLRIEAWVISLDADERRRLGLGTVGGRLIVMFNPSHRLASDGSMRVGLVVQLVQPQTVPVGTLGAVTCPFPAGATMVIDVTGRIRYIVRTATPESRKAQLLDIATRASTTALGWRVAGMDANLFAVDYRGMHENRSR